MIRAESYRSGPLEKGQGLASQGGLLGGGLLTALFLLEAWHGLEARRLLSTLALGLHVGSAQAPASSRGNWKEALPLPPTRPTHLPLRTCPRHADSGTSNRK